VELEAMRRFAASCAYTGADRCSRASNDPLFMYCAEGLSTNGTANWWLGKCGLSGGSSGGPWIQSSSLPTTGSGPVFSVNSWGYTTRSGMAGPKLNGTSAQCLHGLAQSTGGNAAGC
jgi:hypothetical protein